MHEGVCRKSFRSSCEILLLEIGEPMSGSRCRWTQFLAGLSTHDTNATLTYKTTGGTHGKHARFPTTVVFNELLLLWKIVLPVASTMNPCSTGQDT